MSSVPTISEEKRKIIRHLVISTDLTIKQIATAVLVDRTIINDYLKKSKLLELRKTAKTSKNRLLQEAYDQLAAINAQITTKRRGILNPDDVKVKSHLIKEINTLQEKDIASILDTMTAFLNFLIEGNCLDHELVQITPLVEAFIDSNLDSDD